MTRRPRPSAACPTLPVRTFFESQWACSNPSLYGSRSFRDACVIHAGCKFLNRRRRVWHGIPYCLAICGVLKFGCIGLKFDAGFCGLWFLVPAQNDDRRRFLLSGAESRVRLTRERHETARAVDRQVVSSGPEIISCTDLSLARRAHDVLALS